MARVPLYNGGNQPPAPVGARVPMPAALPVGADGRAWSQAFGNVTETLAVMAQKQAEANDTRQLIEAEGEMRRHAMEFQKFQQATTDQEQWLPEWQKRQTELQKRIDGMKLTDGARLRLTQSFGRWADGHAIAIQGESFKQAVGRSVDAIKLRAGEAAKEGDYDGIENSFKLKVPGSMTPEQEALWKADLYKTAEAVNKDRIKTEIGIDLKNRDVEGAKLKVAQAAEFTDLERRDMLATIDSTHAVNAQKDEFQALSLQDPQKALADLEDPAKFSLVSPGDREAMKVQARSILAGQSSDAWRDIKTRIDLGQVKKGETFDDIKELDPLTREVAKLYNASYHDKAGMNSTSEYETAIAAIDNVKDDGSGLARAQVEAAIDARFTGPYAEQLKKRLDARFTAPNQADILREPLAQLHRWAFDEKRLGEFETPVLGPDGNPVVTESTIKTAVPDTSSGFLWWRRFPGMGGPVPTGTATVVEQEAKQVKPVMQDDPTKRDRIAAQVGAIRVQLEKDLQAGKITTPEEAMQRMAELAKQPVVKRAASETGAAPNPLLPALGAPKVDLNEILKRYAPNP